MNPQVPVGALQHKYCKFYQLQFPVLMEKCTALLCSETIQEMDLNQVRFENILSLDLALEQTPLITKLVTKFPAVFDGTGKLDGPNYLEIESDAILVVHPPRKVPIALKPLLKKELQRLHDVGILAPITEPTP